MTATDTDQLRVSCKLIWAALLFLVVVLNLAFLYVGRQGYEDKSMYRACSYASRFSNDPLLKQLDDDLSRISEVDPGTYAYLSGRLQLLRERPYNFVAQNVLVAVLEELPLYSAFQSVFFSHLFLHLLAACTVFWVLEWRFGKAAYVLQVGMLLSLVLNLPRLVPIAYTSFHYLWSAPHPRGAAFLFFFACFLLWHDVGQVSVSMTKRFGLALLLAVASALSHLSMALLFFVPGLCVAGFYHFTKQVLWRWVHRLGVKRCLVLFNIALIAVACAKVSSFWVLSGRGVTLEGLVVTRAALLSIPVTNVLLYFWLKMRLRPDASDDQLVRAGDVFVVYLIAFSILAFGLNAVQLPPDLSAGGLDSYFFILFEGGMRFFAASHLLWWLVLGIYLYERLKHFRPRLLRGMVTGILVFLCLGMTMVFVWAVDRDSPVFDRSLLTVRASDLLAQRGVEAYYGSGDVIFFSALANELRARNVTGP